MLNDKVGSYVGGSGVPVTGNTLYLRTDLDFSKSFGICSCSTDGTAWTTPGGYKFVQMTRDLGLYLVIAIGNGAHKGTTTGNGPPASGTTMPPVTRTSPTCSTRFATSPWRGVLLT
jgi:hypothetical protein